MHTKGYIKTQNKASQKKLENPTLGINPFVKSSSKVCKLLRIDTPLSDETPETINIVSVSLPPIPKGEIRPKNNSKDFPHEHIIYQYSKEFSISLFDQFKKSLVYATEELKANVIVINELGMPLNIKGTVRKEAIKFAKKIANKHNCLIIAGSNHSKDNYLNVGYIFFPGIDKRSEKDHIEFYKNISAFQTAHPEKIFTPSERIIYFTQAFGLGFSFLICLEVADFSSTSSIVDNKKFVDVLIVPTYLENYGTMGKVSKKLSEALGGVLLTNLL